MTVENPSTPLKLSVITINYNNRDGLATTVKSVLSQSCDNVEYIVVDGGSTDGSIEILEQHNNHISHWVSEKDRGIYHAMNKGIKYANGDYILFLNSGDYFFNNEVLYNCSTHFSFDRDLVYGDLQIQMPDKTSFKKIYPEKVSFNYFYYGESLPHPATFIKRNLFNRVGFYNENFRIVSDWEFWLKAIFLNGASYKHIPVLITNFCLDGLSSKPDNLAKSDAEKDIVYASYFPNIEPDYREFKNLKTALEKSRLIKLLRRIGFTKI